MWLSLKDTSSMPMFFYFFLYAFILILWLYHFLWDRPTIQGEHVATFQLPTLFVRRSFSHLLASYHSADGDVVLLVYEGFKIDSWERYCLLPAQEG